MTMVVRLVTVVDLDDRTFPPEVRDAPRIVGPSPDGAVPTAAPLRRGHPAYDSTEMSFSAVHLAVLNDGRRVVLLDDRGWGAHGPSDVWKRTSVEEITDTARMVVGPDEPYGDHSEAEMAAEHWVRLAEILRNHGLVVDPKELALLRHDVQISERVEDRLTRT